MTRLAEVEAKVDRARRLLHEGERQALLLTTHANFAWLTAGGHGFVGLATERASGYLLVTRTARYCLTTNMEAERLQVEELSGLGFEIVESPWYEEATAEAIERLGGAALAGDAPVAGAREMASEIGRLRWPLFPPEVERYRHVARATAEAVEGAAHAIEPGMTEHDIAAAMAQRALAQGLQLNVCLVATDERAYAFRHPLPTDRRLERLALLVLGARRFGLCASVTRVVHFGVPPAELLERHRAVCCVDAAFLRQTRPGRGVADILAAAIEAYREAGFPDEWRCHHQGGATGYAPRDYRATPGCPEVVQPWQAFAWNPSIAGTKSEDTTIATQGGAEVLSRTASWPQMGLEVAGSTVERPDILVR